jgi:type II secretory pathway pseudopilin PulG
MSSKKKQAQKRGFTPLENSLTGFTAFEIFGVVLMVGLLFAFSMPYMLRALIQANEADAITSLGKLSAALEVYRTLYKTYPTNLSSLTIVNPTLSAGQLLSAGAKGGYTYRFEQGSSTRNTFEVIVEPKMEGYTGKRKFKVDQTGNMYTADIAPVIVWSPFNPNTGPTPSSSSSSFSIGP